MSKTLKVIAIAFAFALTVSTVAAATFNTNLTVGSRGADVAALQSWLISKGYSIPAITNGVAPGYFGSQTQMAVKAYQTANGIPSTGFFGPLSRASVNAGGGMAAAGSNPSACPSWAICTPINGGTPPTPNPSSSNGPLKGTDGSISDVNELSQYASEEVGESESDVKVLGFEVEASNDGDILLRSIKVSFDPAGNGSADSDHLDDYIEAVNVWMGDKKIGSADVDDFTEDSNDIYTKTITFSSGVIVRADDIEKFYISVDAANSFDSGDIDSDSWTVDVENIRFEDGSGVVTTETGYEIDGMDVPIVFDTFSSAANTELKISTDSSSPDAGIVSVDDTSNTDDVVLLVGKIKVEGNSDVVLEDLPITLTVATAANIDLVTGNVTLKIDGEEFSESTGANCSSTCASNTTASLTFDDLELTLDAGKTYTFTVLADINDIDDSGFTAGSSLLASVSSSNRNGIDAENEAGDQLTSSEKSGTATGDAQEFRTNGIALTLVGTPETSVAAGTSANDDQGTFRIKFKVTAVGDAVYISTLADAQLSGNTTGKTTVLVDRAGTATVGGTSVTITNLTDTDLTSAGTYMIEEGESETFEVTTTVQLPTAGAAGQFRVVLGGVMWDTDSTDATPDTSYTSNLDAFKTSYVGLN